MSAAEMARTPFDWADAEAESAPTTIHVVNQETRRPLLTGWLRQE
jgi:hypothetical protein